MIVLRSNYSLEERDYTLKRNLTWAMLKARTGVAQGLKKLALNQGKKAEAIGASLRTSKGIVNPKAEHFLNKVAGKRGIMVSHSVPLESMSGGSPFALGAGIVENGSRDLGFSRLAMQGKYGAGKTDITRKLRRLENFAPTKPLVAIPHNGKVFGGVENFAHEMGHLTPVRRISWFSPNPETTAILHGRRLGNIGQAAREANMGKYKVGKAIKAYWNQAAEERRASREGFKLLKQSGTLSPNELKQARQNLRAAYGTYQHNTRAGVLANLAQKIEIPSRRVPNSAYGSTINEAIARRMTSRGLM
jgi:hypothetical protein